MVIKCTADWPGLEKFLGIYHTLFGIVHHLFYIDPIAVVVSHASPHPFLPMEGIHNHFRCTNCYGAGDMALKALADWPDVGQIPGISGAFFCMDQGQVCIYPNAVIVL